MSGFMLRRFYCTFGFIRSKANFRMSITTNEMSHVQTLTSTNEGGPTHQVELTKFQEAEEETVQTLVEVPEIIYKQIANPYPDQTPHRILNRKHRVATIGWNNSMPLQTIAFPYVLLQVPAISDVLDTFYYMRASVQVEIRINATQFHIGALMATWLPNSNVLVNTYKSSMIRRSANHPMIISASTQNAITLKIPWINPYNYFIIPKVTSNVGEIGTLNIEAVCPLRTVSPTVTDSVEIQVFASFEDIEVAGYVEAQSGMKNFSRDKGKISSEAKSKTDNLASMATTTTSIATMLEKVPIIGDAVSGLMSLAGLFDKPLNVSSTQFVSQSFSRDFAMVDGVDNCQPLSLHPISAKASALNLMGHDGEDITINEIIRTPMLRTVHTFSSASPSNFTDYLRPWDQTRQDDYLKYVSRMFSYWRGSIKYHFHFITSTFTSARFKITVLYGTDTPDDDSGNQISTIVDVKGDTIFETTIPFLHATMYELVNPADSVDYDSFPRINVQPISKIVSSSNEVDAIIYMMVWRAAGEDFMFNQMVKFNPTQFPTPESEFEIVEAQTDLRTTFKKVFPPIMEGACFTTERGYVTSEQATTVRELSKRYDTVDPPFLSPLNTFPTPGTGNSPFHRFANIFMYWSGSRRVKLISVADQPSPFIAVSMSDPTYTFDVSPALGMAFTHKTFWPMLEAEVPYYSSVPFWYTNSNASAIVSADDVPRAVNLNFTPAITDPVFISAGDDFVYGFLVPPPLY